MAQTNKTMTETIKEHIEDCLRTFALASEINKPFHHQRLDELFLLWAKLKNISFVKACEFFGINYLNFTDKDYSKIGNQIVIKYKKYFDRIGDY